MKVRWDLEHGCPRGAGRRIRFEGLRKREAPIPENTTLDQREYMLAHTELTCQTGGACHDALACLHCRKFVGYRPSLLRGKLLIRCLWHDRDLVSDLMTTGASLLCLPADTPVREADRACREYKTHHLLVVDPEDTDEVVGVGNRARWFPFEERRCTLADVMDPQLSLVPGTMDLGEAAGLMADLALDCLLVTDGGDVVGVLTRSDLEDVGVAPQLLGRHACASCGCRSGVRKHPQLDVEFCLDCLEQAQTSAVDDAVWEGC